MGEFTGYTASAVKCIRLLKDKEKEGFKAYLRASFPPNSHAKYLELFTGLQKARIPKTLVPKRFKNRKALDDGCKHLGQKLIDFICLMRSRDRLEFCLENDLSKLVREIVKKEFKRAQDGQDIEAMAGLIRICYKHRYWPDVEGFPQNDNEVAEVFYEQAVLVAGNFLYAKANAFINRRIGHLLLPERVALFHQHKEQALGLFHSKFYPLSQARIRYVQAIWFMLKRDFTQVELFLRHRLDIMQEYPDLFTAAEVFWTCKTLFHSILYRRDYGEAKDIIYELGGLEGPSESDNQVMLASWYMLSLLQAASGGDMDLGRAALRRLDQFPAQDLMEMDASFVYLAAAVVAMYENDWERAERVYKKVNREMALRISFRSDLLGVLIAFELDEPALARKRAYKFFARLRKEVNAPTLPVLEKLEQSFLHWCTSSFHTKDLPGAARDLEVWLDSLPREESSDVEWFHFQPLLGWIKTKAHGVDFLTAIRQDLVAPLIWVSVLGNTPEETIWGIEGKEEQQLLEDAGVVEV